MLYCVRRDTENLYRIVGVRIVYWSSNKNVYW